MKENKDLQMAADFISAAIIGTAVFTIMWYQQASSATSTGVLATMISFVYFDIKGCKEEKENG